METQERLEIKLSIVVRKKQKFWRTLQQTTVIGVKPFLKRK